MFHDGAKHYRLQVLPIVVAHGHGNEIGTEKCAIHAGHVEQLGARQ